MVAEEFGGGLVVGDGQFLQRRIDGGLDQAVCRTVVTVVPDLPLHAKHNEMLTVVKPDVVVVTEQHDRRVRRVGENVTPEKGCLIG